MKIIMISEKGYTGKIPDNHEHWTFDMTLQYGLDAYHIPASQVLLHRNFGDICIIIPSKGRGFQKKFIKYIRSASPGTKIAIMQEGSSFEWQDRPLDYIKDYIEVFQAGDCILAHTTRDVAFYKAFHDKVMRVPTCIHLESIEKHRIEDWKSKENIIFAKGNLMSKFNLPFQIQLAKTAKDYKIVIPTIKAERPEDFKLFEGVEQLPYMPYKEWHPYHTKFKINLNIINGVAAGQECLTSAALGIPCISTSLLNTSLNVFPELAIAPHDFEAGVTLLKKLTNDEKFYESVREAGIQRVQQYDYKIVCPKFIKELLAFV